MGTVAMRDFSALVMMTTFIVGFVSGQDTEGSGFVNSTDYSDATLINEDDEFVPESDIEIAQDVSLRDPKVFPVCVTDEDCDGMTNEHGDDYKCFQYMCYPWNKKGEGAPFRGCKRRSDCSGLTEEEGGDGEDGDCFRHQDRRNVFTGICLEKRQNTRCFEHSDCPGDLKCINGFCGDKQYFQELGSFSCEVSTFCEELLIGDLCCYDFTAEFNNETEAVSKKCCIDENSVPAIVPAGEVFDDHIAMVDMAMNTIPTDQTESVCNQFEYQTMERLTTCLSFTTTTTTTPTTTTTTTTKPVVADEAKVHSVVADGAKVHPVNVSSSAVTSLSVILFLASLSSPFANIV